MKKVFSGIYSWDGKRHGNRTPIAWFPGSYHLHIFEAEHGSGKVTPLKPYLCLYQETGQGHSVSAEPERFVKHICEDFTLTLDRVLWVELLPSPSVGCQVVVFTRSGRLGTNMFFKVSKRSPNSVEQQVIDQALLQLFPPATRSLDEQV